MKDKKVENNQEVQTAQVSELDALKAKIAKMQEEHQSALERALKAKEDAERKIKELKSLEKEELQKQKTLEAKARAKSLAEALAKQETATPKRNLTEEIRKLMLEEKTVDEMMQILGVERKQILDRRWLIEKRAGLR